MVSADQLTSRSELILFHDSSPILQFSTVHTGPEVGHLAAVSNPLKKVSLSSLSQCYSFTFFYKMCHLIDKFDWWVSLRPALDGLSLCIQSNQNHMLALAYFMKALWVSWCIISTDHHYRTADDCKTARDYGLRKDLQKVVVWRVAAFYNAYKL